YQSVQRAGDHELGVRDQPRHLPRRSQRTHVLHVLESLVVVLIHETIVVEIRHIYDPSVALDTRNVFRYLLLEKNGEQMPWVAVYFWAFVPGSHQRLARQWPPDEPDVETNSPFQISRPALAVDAATPDDIAVFGLVNDRADRQQLGSTLVRLYDRSMSPSLGLEEPPSD